MHFFVFSKQHPPQNPFFCGYVFVKSDIIFEQEGADQYLQQTGQYISYGEDGCYTCGLKTKEGFSIGTDYVGNGRVFYYKTIHFWAISNSFYKLVQYLRTVTPEGFFSKTRPDLTPKPHILQAFNIERPFGNQLQTFQTTSNSISLLPSDKYINITRNRFEIRSVEQTGIRGYEEHLRNYLNTWLSRIYTALNFRISLSIDITGGLDTRSTLAMFQRVRESTDEAIDTHYVTFHSAEREGHSDDFRIAQNLAFKYNFILNAHAYRKQSEPRTVEQIYSLWKHVALGTYSPYRLPSPHHHPMSLSLSGGGGECFRPFYKHESENTLINSCKRFFSTQKDFSEWKRVVQNDMNKIKPSESNSIPTLIYHYRNFRTRFHTGSSAHYRNLMLPLQSRILFDASRSISPILLKTKQISYDIIASCAPELLYDDFDDPNKAPTEDNLANITIVYPTINQGGKVFGPQRDQPLAQDSPEPEQAPSMIEDVMLDMLNYCEEMGDPTLISLFFIDDARIFLERLRRNDPTLRPKEGRQIHNVILAGFLSGLEI